MASSAGTDAIGEAEAATAGSGKKSRRRISDYLGTDSDDGAEASPPQLRLPRFTCARFRFVRLGRKRDGRRKEVLPAKKTEDYSPAGSKPAEETSTSASPEAGGMGLSMLLLLARTCVELNRMAEVRAQMETLLKEMRDEAGRMKKAGVRNHRHDVVVTPRTTFNNLHLLSSSTTTVSSSSCTTDTDTNHHHHATTEEIARREGESRQAEDEERCAGSVVELEAAEFDAEPAPHRPSLQCVTDQDESSDDDFIELDEGRHFGGVNGDDIKWDAGDGDSSSEDEPSTCAQDGGGVSAAELERRLHELLHRRNRDRIAELESALRRAEQRLREKEMEARLWQDTATVALQPPPPPADGQ